MNDLIEALTILKKYSKDTKWPTHCEHDILMVHAADNPNVSEQDYSLLDKLGFHWNEDYECWCSYRFGSC